MLERIQSLFGFGRNRQVTHSGGMQSDSRFDDGTQPRAWDGAEHTEENSSQWLFADGRTINQVLMDHHETIVNRSIHEARRNPTVEGVIKSHAGDVVGDEGPGLQMLSDDDAWNDQAESIWKEFSDSIDSSGKLSIGEWLRQGIYQSWVTGDMICQLVEPTGLHTPIKFRVHPISGQRLKSPYTRVESDIMLGIQRDRFNRPLFYYFEDEIRSEYGYQKHDIKPIRARDILHFFEELEPGQVRGWPRLASCLQAISDLREYDNAVLDAAKVQAMMHVIMSTTSDMVEPEESPAAVKLKRMGVTRAPVGWNMNALQTSQPNSNNTEFRNERIRELGRASAMPLMQIRLDSSGHNYSSARFDGQNYQKACRIIQGSIGRHRVRPIVNLVMVEAMMTGILRPKIITKDMVNFRWPQPPHVDPVKEAMAERIRLENRTLSPQMAAASHNLDFDKICHEWRIANDILKKNGMPELLGGIPTDLNALKNFLSLDDAGADENEKPNPQTAA